MPIASNFPDLELVETNVFSFLFNGNRSYPDDQVLFRDATNLSRKHTVSQLRSSAIDFGRGLKGILDFKKSHVLSIFAPNDIDFPAIVFGTLWTGGIVSPANPTYTKTELARQLIDSGASVLVTHASVLETARQACAEVGIPDSHIILLGEKTSVRRDIKHWTSIKDYEGFIRNRMPKIEPRKDVAFLVYSSGTTGLPKGVELTHHNMTSNLQQINQVEQPLSWDGSKSCSGVPDPPKGKGDKILACLPFYHVFGLNLLVHHPVLTGVECVVMPRFDLQRWCQSVQDLHISVSYVVPPIVLLLAKHPLVEDYDLSSLRMLSSGAAPLRRELTEAVYKRKCLRIKQGYGLSETCCALFSMRWHDWNKSVGSAGVLLPNIQAKFCAPDSGSTSTAALQEVPKGEQGELYVKGPNIFRGYHNNPAATRECLQDGWFRTGDVGFMDESGNLTITDRVKELIKYKGFQVAPAELEGTLVDHFLIDDVAVIGTYSKESETEVPRAFVVRQGGLEAVRPGDDTAIVEWLNGRVSSHKRLRGGVEFVDSIPKSPSGKILRRVLAEKARKDASKVEQIDGLKARL